MSALVIRPVDSSDVDAVVDLYSRAFAPYGGDRRRVWLDGTLVAESDGRFAGFVAGALAGTDVWALFDEDAPGRWLVAPEVLLPQLWRDGAWDARSRVISAVAVEPALRRGGLGRELVSARIELWGGPPVFAHCVEGSGSRELFAGMGFQAILHVDRFYAKSFGMTLMWRSQDRAYGSGISTS